MTRVTSVSSPPLLLLFLAISMAIAAAVVPLWDSIVLLGTAFFFYHPDDQVRSLCMVITMVKFLGPIAFIEVEKSMISAKTPTLVAFIFIFFGNNSACCVGGNMKH